MTAHDCVSIAMTFPETQAQPDWVAVCRCRRRFTASDKDAAIAAHTAHFDAERGLAGVERARRALEGNDGA